jgi:hypothetical protein
LPDENIYVAKNKKNSYITTGVGLPETEKILAPIHVEKQRLENSE